MTNTTLSLDFPSVSNHEVVVLFDGGDISSDAGVALVSAADKKMGLTSLLALAFDDKRDPWIASTYYCSLDTESHGIIYGMDLMGQHEYARRSI